MRAFLWFVCMAGLAATLLVSAASFGGWQLIATCPRGQRLLLYSPAFGGIQEIGEAKGVGWLVSGYGYVSQPPLAPTHCMRLPDPPSKGR